LRKPFPNLGLYVIIDGGLISPGRLEEALEQTLLGDADAIQLRAKQFSKRRYYETAVAILPYVRRMRIPFFVNDHLDIALAIRADGIHLGQDDLPCGAARRLTPKGMLVGVSTHSVEQAAKAVADGADYVAIGPVFLTSTKQNPEPLVGLRAVMEVKSRVGDVPVIAIGGINKGNVSEVIRSGADGVAVASAVTLADDPAAAAKELKHKMQSVRDQVK
jgi:thiamine-phosphate pyrophosphorylase